jgi:hypothetical protein
MYRLHELLRLQVFLHTTAWTMMKQLKQRIETIVANTKDPKERDFMKFLHLHLFHKEVEFGNIEGYDDIKDVVKTCLGII